MGDLPVLSKDSTPAEVRAAWIATLRTDLFEQGTQYLGRVDLPGEKPDGARPVSYCCLGVLCELAVEAGLLSRSRPVGYGSIIYAAVDNPDDGDTQHLPVAVQKWAGINGSSVVLPAPTGFELPNGNEEVENADVTDLNDGGAYTFKQIADLLEAHFASTLPDPVTNPVTDQTSTTN